MVEMNDLSNEVLSHRSSMKATTAREEVESPRRNMKINIDASKSKVTISLSK